MTDKELYKLLLKNGWKEDRINGSHHIFAKGDETISLPVHNRDTLKGLLSKILKQAKLK